MRRKFPPLLLTLGLAAVMWIVPSVGTQGMGTIGQGFTHADSAVIDSEADTVVARDAVRSRLQRADTATETALGY